MIGSFLLNAISRHVQKTVEVIGKERARLFTALIAREATEDDLPAAATPPNSQRSTVARAASA
jgi:hypothetical protein